MSFKIVQPSTMFVLCPSCGAEGKIVRHPLDWVEESPYEFIGPIRLKIGDATKLKCRLCSAEFPAQL
jgi:hypothetical protein